METIDRTRYGAFESNGLVDFEAASPGQGAETVWLDDSRLARVTRLRMLTDRDFPMWDVSYCWGVLKDGTQVRVNLPVTQFRKSSIKGDIIAMCKREGVYAKGLGLLDSVSVWSQVFP